LKTRALKGSVHIRLEAAESGFGRQAIFFADAFLPKGLRPNLN